MKTPNIPNFGALGALASKAIGVAESHLAPAGFALAAVIGLMLLRTKSELNTALERNGELALRSYNQAAALDTTRRVALSAKDSARILGDSLHAVTRLALQEKQTRTDLDKALHVERKTTAELSQTVAQLKITTTSTAPVATDGAGERSGSFHVRQEPWTLDATAFLPQTGAGRLSATVSIDTAHFTLAHECDAPNADGIRPARVVITGPPWLTTTVSRASQDPAICDSPALRKPGHAWWQPSFRPEIAFGGGIDGTGRRVLAVIITPLHWP